MARSGAFARQWHPPGAEGRGEGGFGEVVGRLARGEAECFLFCFRLSSSGKTVDRAWLSGGREAFFGATRMCFASLGGVRSGKVCCDSLKWAVASVLGLGRARVETDRGRTGPSRGVGGERLHSDVAGHRGYAGQAGQPVGMEVLVGGQVGDLDLE